MFRLRRTLALLLASLLGIGLMSSPAEAATTPKVSIKSSSYSPYVGSSVKVSGSVSSKSSGAYTYLQKYYSGAWHGLAKYKLKSSRTYSFTTKITSTTRYSYRVYVKKTKYIKAAKSKTISITGRKVPVKDNCPNGDYTSSQYDGQCGTKPPVKDNCPAGDYTASQYDGQCGTKPVDPADEVSDYTSDQLRADMLKRINDYRVANGVSRLVTDVTFSNNAQSWSAYQASFHDVFDHGRTSPSNTPTINMAATISAYNSMPDHTMGLLIRDDSVLLLGDYKYLAVGFVHHQGDNLDPDNGYTGNWTIDFGNDVPVVTPDPTMDQQGTATIMNDLLTKINSYRTSHGLTALQRITALNTVAQNQSNYQSANTTLQARTDLVSISPDPYLIKAEQVSRSNSAQQTYDGLVALHPEILTGNYKYIGIGLKTSIDSAYAGYFTMDFAIDKPPPVDPGYTLDEVRELILSKVNQYRSSNSKPALQLNSDLNTVAQNWTLQMASSNTLSHNPNYSAQYPSGWTAAGENLASGQTADNVVEAWINSPEHRANLLGDYTYLGVGYAKSTSGQTYFTQNFAKY